MTITTPAHHTADHWAQRPRSLNEFVVKSVLDSGDYLTLTSESGWGWMARKADLSREIRVGERLQQETIGITFVTGLRDDNGWLYRRTDQELADEARKFTEDMNRKDAERLEKNRAKYAEQERALPEWLQARIKRFHDAGGENFQLTGWGYELLICRMADLIDRGQEIEADQIASAEGASGNQWDCAKTLAAGRERYGDRFGTGCPAGLAPITGSVDYA